MLGMVSYPSYIRNSHVESTGIAHPRLLLRVLTRDFDVQLTQLSKRKRKK